MVNSGSLLKSNGKTFGVMAFLLTVSQRNGLVSVSSKGFASG